MTKRQAGFTLIEIMIAVAVIGILTAIALPSYNGYMMRARLSEAFTGLSGAQPKLEQHWSNERTYAGFDTAAGQMPQASQNFTFTLTTATASSYVLTATGRNGAANFSFTIDQNGNRVTTGVPSGWTSSTTCWVDRKEGKCAQ